MTEGAHGNDSLSGAHWQDEEVLALIRIWSEEEIFRETEDTRQKKKPVYTIISSRLANVGINREPKQVRIKIRAIKTQFKKVLEHNNRSGNDRRTMKFFDELNRFLGHRPAINPPQGSVLESTDRSDTPSTSSSPDLSLSGSTDREYSDNHGSGMSDEDVSLSASTERGLPEDPDEGMSDEDMRSEPDTSEASQEDARQTVAGQDEGGQDEDGQDEGGQDEGGQAEGGHDDDVQVAQPRAPKRRRGESARDRSVKILVEKVLRSSQQRDRALIDSEAERRRSEDERHRQEMELLREQMALERERLAFERERRDREDAARREEAARAERERREERQREDRRFALFVASFQNQRPYFLPTQESGFPPSSSMPTYQPHVPLPGYPPQPPPSYEPDIPATGFPATPSSGYRSDDRSSQGAPPRPSYEDGSRTYQEL